MPGEWRLEEGPARQAGGSQKIFESSLGILAHDYYLLKHPPNPKKEERIIPILRIRKNSLSVFEGS